METKKRRFVQAEGIGVISTSAVSNTKAEEQVFKRYSHRQGDRTKFVCNPFYVTLRR